MYRMTAMMVMALVLLVGNARAQSDAKARELYTRVSPSLVVVQYTYDFELGRQELTTIGIVIGGEGLVVIPEAITPPGMPDAQMVDFKIIIPGDEETEIDADFQGRDDRSMLSFVKAREKRTWQPLKFEDGSFEVGDQLYSVGLLPKDAGYKTYLLSSRVSSVLRGPVPQVLVSGDGLGAVGSPVFNAAGAAVGYVHAQGNSSPLLGSGGGRGRGGVDSLTAVLTPPKLFVPSKDFLSSLADPPTPASQLKIPHLGVSNLSGLQKAEAEYFNLKGQTAIQIGDVIPNFPADKGGLKPRDIIVKMNGQPLERGDEPDEAPAIMTRKIQRMKPGDKVTFSVVTQRDQPVKEVTITLEERPKQRSIAKRYFAEDLGFASRELVFEDTYSRKLPADSKGIVVDLIKPQSSAQAQLRERDLIMKLNQTEVTDIDQFKTSYESFRKDRPRDAVVLEVLRGVNTQIVRIEPPQ